MAILPPQTQKDNTNEPMGASLHVCSGGQGGRHVGRRTGVIIKAFPGSKCFECVHVDNMRKRTRGFRDEQEPR